MQRKYSEVVNFVPNYPTLQNRHNSREPSSNQKLSPVEQVRPSYSPTVYNNTQYQTFLSPNQIQGEAAQSRNASFQFGERRSLPSYNPKIDGVQQIQSPVFDPRTHNNNGFRNSSYGDQVTAPRRIVGQNLSSQPLQNNFNSPQNITKVRQFDTFQLPQNLARNLQTTHTSPVKLEIPQRTNTQHLNVLIPRHQLNPNLSNTNNNRQNGRICQSMIIQQTPTDLKLLGNNSGLSGNSNVSNASNGNNSTPDLQSTFSSDHNYSSYLDLNSPVYSQPGGLKAKRPQINPRYRKNDDVWKSAEFSLLKNNNNYSTSNLNSFNSSPTNILDTIKEKQEMFMKQIRRNIQSLKMQQKQKKFSLMETKAQTPTAIDSPLSADFKFRKKNDMGYSQTIDMGTPKAKQTPRNWTIDDFETIDKLGRGTYGQVFLVRQRKSKFVCVLKTMSKKRIKQLNLQEHVFRQIKIQTYLVHKHLTALYGVFHDQNKIYLILECMPDGSMASNGKRKISQEQTAHLIYQVCDGLQYMHREDIIHRDIKPQNLLLNSVLISIIQAYLKIGDFGCSVFGNSLRRTVVGCYAYISPQQFSNNPYDQKIDSWCVGTLTYQLLTGKPPYEQKLKQIALEAQKQQKITKQGIKTVQFPEITTPKDIKISSQALDFIKRLLDNDPVTRADLKQALKHKFLQKAKQYQKYLQSKL